MPAPLLKRLAPFGKILRLVVYARHAAFVPALVVYQHFNNMRWNLPFAETRDDTPSKIVQKAAYPVDLGS